MNVSLAKATPDNLADLAHIHLASKKVGETGIVDQEFLDSKTEQEYQLKWGEWLEAEDSQTYIAFNNENVAVVFISFVKLRTPPPGTSKIRPLYANEIYALYVHPDFFRQGVGRLLLKKAISLLAENNQKSLCLWALQKNKQACDFYEAMQAQRVGKQKAQMGRFSVTEICFAWRDISVV
ncbi:MAG: GNAT family N-acetyltransferase, partial [Pseudomonadota bacterium]